MRSPKDELLVDLKCSGITNEQVLNALAQVPRERFVEEPFVINAYDNCALPLCCGQTISQPYVVARMTQILLDEVGEQDRFLEIGTGSGYQAAVLSYLVKEVYTIERVEALYEQAKSRLTELGYENIHLRYGDGTQGWVEHAPYFGIIVTAACEAVPKELLEQLAVGGCLIAPVGCANLQQLQVITRTEQGYLERYLDHVVFVPLLSNVRGKEK